MNLDDMKVKHDHFYTVFDENGNVCWIMPHPHIEGNPAEAYILRMEDVIARHNQLFFQGKGKHVLCECNGIMNLFPIKEWKPKAPGE